MVGMKKMAIASLVVAFLLITCFGNNSTFANTAASVQAPNPVSYFGQMQVDGNRIHGSKTGAPMQVKGASFFWSNWSANFWNTAMVNRMVDEFKSEIVRASYGVDDNGTPYNIADEAKVREIVNAAVNKGIYVVIDWHTHGAQYNVGAAKDFFSRMAQEFGSYDNVIFEIYNEPLQIPWSTIKGYAEKVIPVIRQHSDNLIVVGTPTWSQDVDQAAFDKIKADNIAYAFHFYVGTHGRGLVDKLNTALNNGTAIFATEWGFWNTNIDPMTADEWMSVLDQNKISWANWAINDKNEPASFFNADGSLTSAGQYFKNELAKHALTAEWRKPTDSQIIPGTIEAEAYSNSSGIKVEPCAEGGSNVGYVDSGDWLDYKVDVAKSGTYKVNFRVASLNGATDAFQLKEGNHTLATVNVPNTGDWQKWTNETATVNLNAGSQILRIYANTSGWNLNYMQFIETTDQPPQTKNLISNGDFASGLTDWDFIANTANASASVSNGEAIVSITTPGAQTYMPQLVQDGFFITSGQKYTVTFDAKAASNRTMELSVNSGPTDYTNMFKQSVNLTTSMHPFTYTFTANITDSNARIDFNCGGNTGNVTIDNVTLSKADGNIPPVASNL